MRSALIAAQLNVNVCSICGIELPNGELVGGDDEEVAAALGCARFCRGRN